tara:strand:+ start:94 stop:648 length:555 start_codon:yes stop_codon:yes gene_type:complete
MNFFYLILVSALFFGCGQDTDKTAEQPISQRSPQTQYGTPAEITGYIQTIGPFIRVISEAEITVQQQVNDQSGQATGKNLSRAMQEVLPSLREAFKNFDKVEPPPLLAPLHKDIKQLFSLRLDAYNDTIKGWELEQSAEESDLYVRAENKMKEANILSQKLNQEMAKIQQSLIDQAESNKTTQQ